MTSRKISLSTSVLATLAYADIFDYPLTLVEVWRWLVGSQTSIRSVFHILKKLVQQEKIIFLDGFYCLPKQEKNIKLRIHKNKCAQLKWQIACRAGKVLKNIPTVQLVGVTGALAMDNAGANDDIDLMIIAKAHTMWLTRLVVTLITELLFHRRHPRDRHIANTVCLNLFTANRMHDMRFAPHDIYIAHELLHLRPVYYRDHLYKKMLKANKWVTTLLPNRWREVYE